jgi:hypothetical protein
MSRIGHNCFGARKLLQCISHSMARSYLDHIGRGMLKKGRGEGVSFFRTEKIRAISGILFYLPLLAAILIRRLPEHFCTVYAPDIFEKVESSLGATNARSVIAYNLALNWNLFLVC